MNKQEMFDTAYLTMYKQGWQPSRSPHGGCAYRGDNARVCAIGALIPDELYHAGYESCSVDFLLAHRHLVDSFDGLLHKLRQHLIGDDLSLVSFLTDLQGAHDATVIGDPFGMQALLERCARAHGLTVPELPMSALGKRVSFTEVGYDNV